MFVCANLPLETTNPTFTSTTNLQVDTYGNTFDTPTNQTFTWSIEKMQLATHAKHTIKNSLKNMQIPTFCFRTESPSRHFCEQDT